MVLENHRIKINEESDIYATALIWSQQQNPIFNRQALEVQQVWTEHQQCSIFLPTGSDPCLICNDLIFKATNPREVVMALKP